MDKNQLVQAEVGRQLEFINITSPFFPVTQTLYRSVCFVAKECKTSNNQLSK